MGRSTRRPWRSVSAIPTSRSNAASCIDTAGGLRCSSDATAAIVPSRDSSASIRKRRTSKASINFTYTLRNSQWTRRIAPAIMDHVKSIKVLAAGLAVVVLWASAFPAIRVAAPSLSVAGLSLVRLAVAALVLLAIAPFARVRPPERGQVPLVIVAAFFGMTAYQLLLNWGELAVPAGPASIIVAAAPLVSMAVATLTLGERFTLAKVAGSTLAVAGVGVVALARSGAPLTSAIAIVAGAAVVQGIYHPLTKPLLRTRSGLEVATYGQVAGAAMTLPTLPLGWHALLAASAPAWGAAIYLALLPSAAGFVLWGYAVARLPVATSTALLWLVPPVAVLIAFVWLGEVPYPRELLGGLVVIAGVITVGRGDRLVARWRTPWQLP